MTEPWAFVERRALAMLDMAMLVVVAFVVVEFPVMTRFPTIVEDAALMTMPEVVALVPAVGCVHASYVRRPVASVPHERTPAVLAFTSQFAAFKLETMSCEVEARPETARLVVVALVVVVFVKMLFPVHVLFEYVFGIVVEASMKAMADVVDHERPAAVKYVFEVVEKKLFTFFQASALVVLNERPTEVKYAAEEVEKKLLAALYASADVVAQARPTELK